MYVYMWKWKSTFVCCLDCVIVELYFGAPSFITRQEINTPKYIDLFNAPLHITHYHITTIFRQVPGRWPRAEGGKSASSQKPHTQTTIMKTSYECKQ